jgi:hypothetical protein
MIVQVLDSVLLKLKEGYVPEKLYIVLPTDSKLRYEFMEYWCNNGFHKHLTKEDILESN